MSEVAAVNNNKDAVPENISDADLEIILQPGYRTYVNYLERALEIYDRTRAAFFALKANDRALLAAAKRWERATITLERWAESYFLKTGGTEEERLQASEIMDMISKDSAARSTNISRYYDLLAENHPEKMAELEEAEKADLHHLDVLNRVLNTQESYLKRLQMGEAGCTREERMEFECSKTIRDRYARIPEGHIYRPAYPYPPERIPEDEPVPPLPEPIQRSKELPLEDLVYDETIDEFVARPGYLSEDKRIDDKSMVFHPETQEIEYGFVGGPRKRWKYWKAKDDRDVPDPNCWAVQYTKRYYDTYVREPERRLLEPWPYEYQVSSE